LSCFSGDPRWLREETGVYLGMLTFPLRVAGKVVPDAPTATIRAPWSGEAIGTIGLAAEEQASAAAAHAAAIFPETRRLPGYERKRLLRAVADGVREERAVLAGLLSQECGKPIALAEGEVARAIATLELGAEEATRWTAEMLPLDASEATRGAIGIVERAPLGPVFALSPFNFPLNLVCHKVAPALALGVPLVLKPAPQAPLCAHFLAQIVENAGGPAGIFQVVPCAIPVAEALARDPRFPVLSFTGSVKVGYHLRALVPHKRVVLELGGNAAAIVLADADLDLAIDKIVAGAFAYAGQVCIKTQRVYAEAAVYDRLVAGLVRKAKDLTVKSPDDRTALLSSVIDEGNAARIDGWVDEAVAAGAKVLVRGQRQGNRVPPVVLAIDDPHQGAGLRVVDEEVFGPVLTLHRVADRTAALQEANRGKFGLQAAIFTHDLAAIDEAFATLEVGGLIVNDGTTFRVDAMPYGGARQSGSGREGVRYAMEDLTERKILVRRRG
jgi:acyl-CoA reductase-like NAD-dependent aldehyde dehydrogenase